MTRCEFTIEGTRITKFSVYGHSDYAEAGQDVVCAAVSAIVYMAEVTINDVCGTKVKVREIHGKNPKITLALPASCDEEECVQNVLMGMMLTLSHLRDEYPDFIEVLEV